MKHQLMVLFAASLKAEDGDGVRVCIGIKEISSEEVPARNGTTLTIAGFDFRQFGDSLVQDGYTTYVFEPVRSVRYETFTFNQRITGFKKTRSAMAGVLVSAGNCTILNLIEALKADYGFVLGTRANGGLNSYSPH